MKVNNNTKLLIAKEHINEGTSFKELSSKYGVKDIGDIKYFIQLYEKHGEQIFIGRDQMQDYTREFKLTALNRVLVKGESIRSAASEMGVIDPTTVADWIRLYRLKGEDGIQTTRRRKSYELKEEKLDRIANKELKERIKHLEAENEYLKNLHTLVLGRKQQPKKK